MRLLILSLVLGACTSAKPTPPPPSQGPEIHISVGAEGYTPSEARAAAGKPVRLVFTRVSDDGCGQQLVVPSLKIRRDLPLNEAVAVDLTMPTTGTVTFTCGMDMYQGAVVVQ